MGLLVGRLVSVFFCLCISFADGFSFYMGLVVSLGVFVFMVVLGSWFGCLYLILMCWLTYGVFVYVGFVVLRLICLFFFLMFGCLVCCLDYLIVNFFVGFV